LETDPPKGVGLKNPVDKTAAGGLGVGRPPFLLSNDKIYPRNKVNQQPITESTLVTVNKPIYCLNIVKKDNIFIINAL
jgi:hypothetical protein